MRVQSLSVGRALRIQLENTQRCIQAIIVVLEKPLCQVWLGVEKANTGVALERSHDRLDKD